MYHTMGHTSRSLANDFTLVKIFLEVNTCLILSFENSLFFSHSQNKPQRVWESFEKQISKHVFCRLSLVKKLKVFFFNRKKTSSQKKKLGSSSKKAGDLKVLSVLSHNFKRTKSRGSLRTPKIFYHQNWTRSHEKKYRIHKIAFFCSMFLNQENRKHNKLCITPWDIRLEVSLMISHS